MAPERRHDLDALRVLAVLVLLAYHASRPFDLEPWHVKSPEQSVLVQLLGGVFTPWRLPLLFMVSGAGTYFALRRRTLGAYARERLSRLGIPLLAGMLIVIPPQVYVERISSWMPDRQSPHDFQGSFLAFYPHVFAGIYPQGNFSWHHLWFLVYLLVFSLVALPLFRGLAAIRQPLGLWLARPGTIWLPALSLATVHVALRGRFPPTNALVGDWWNLAHYFVVFLLGYLLVADETFRAAAARYRHVAALLFVVLTALRIALIVTLPPATPYSAVYVLMLTIRGGLEWAALVAVLGYAHRHLDHPLGWLRWSADRVYPFYVWHQTVIVVLAAWVLGWPTPAALQYLVLLLGGLAITVLLCALLARTKVTRLLFGMKP